MVNLFSSGKYLVSIVLRIMLLCLPIIIASELHDTEFMTDVKTLFLIQDN
jgi:hypothetical protein